MIALAVLAASAPLAIAWMTVRVLELRSAEAAKLSSDQADRLLALEARADAHGHAISDDKAEIRRLAEQVSLLADRYR